MLLTHPKRLYLISVSSDLFLSTALLFRCHSSSHSDSDYFIHFNAILFICIDNMPRKCSVASCKTNYEYKTSPSQKTPVYRYPSYPDESKRWIAALRLWNIYWSTVNVSECPKTVHHRIVPVVKSEISSHPDEMDEFEELDEILPGFLNVFFTFSS